MSELINNSQFRKDKLKELIKALHGGADFHKVREEFEKHFSSVSTKEISDIEHTLVKEGLPIEEIQRLCDVHASLFQGGIHDIHHKKDYGKIPGHPLNIFMAENRALEKLIDEELTPTFESFMRDKDNNSYLLLRIAFDRLWEIDKHYARKENLFFPYLEKKGVTAPPKVMWGVDDEIREDIKSVISLLNEKVIDFETMYKRITNTVKRVKDMIFKEEHILIPLLSDTLTLYNWINIDEAGPDMGYTLIKPEQSWKAETQNIPEKEKQEVSVDPDVLFDAGRLNPKEINAILKTVPFDLTFIDKHDKVKYFTQGKERIFKRPKTVLGRDVALCHPPASVHIVNGIVEAFRNGEKDHEDFWIKARDMFIYIRYYAVRDNKGGYLGTLEVTQNIKPITELQGEKRLVKH